MLAFNQWETMECLAFEEQHDQILVWEGHFEDGHGEAGGKKTD